MRISASKLRKNIYTLLDQVLETGIALEVERKGEVLKIVAERRPSKLSRLKKHDVIVGDPEELVHIDWLQH